MGTGYAGPVFLRFPQSTQETYYWSSGSATHSQTLSTQAFRQGVRGYNPSITDPSLSTQLHYLTLSQIETLASAIAGLVVAKAAVSGPFLSLEELLGPNAAFDDQSLLAKAIGDTGINAPDLADRVSDPLQPGYGSLTLTPADIMTALAPYLRTRSDTFLVRAYGDVVNPATGTTETNVVAEATVQRLLSTADSNDNIVQPSLAGLGRQFRIVSLRWLSPSDI